MLITSCSTIPLALSLIHAIESCDNIKAIDLYTINILFIESDEYTNE